MIVMYFRRIKQTRIRFYPTVVRSIFSCTLAVLYSWSGFALGDGIPKPGNDELARIVHLGDLPVLRESPTFFPVRIQLQNQNPLRKIQPKSTREITSNYVGATPPRLPRTEAFDLVPFHRVHLIDGDTKTLWMCRGQAKSKVQPEWIRIDLPYEMELSRIVLRGLEESAGGWPAEIKVLSSRDSLNWLATEEVRIESDPTKETHRVFQFGSEPIKQIKIVGKDFQTVKLYGAEGAVELGHGFCLSEVEAYDNNQENVALLSKGAGVTVSSTNYGYGDKRSMHDMLWPIHYDLGTKHLKIAYWDSTLNWHYVENKKGIYEIDPKTDQAITDSIENGCEVYMTLSYGNWLYADANDMSSVERWRFWQFPFQKPPVPRTPEQVKAFCDYCRFVVKHFKGRITYYEIWNEQNIPYSWPAGETEAFCHLLKEAAKAVKETDPQAKVMLGGVCFCDLDYFEEMFQQGVAEVVDVICWHPYQWEVAPEESYPIPYKQEKKSPYPSYRAQVAAIREAARRHGFKGDEYHANETTWVSPYPAPDIGVPGGPVSEMTKAKYVARTIALHTDMGIPVYYNETWNTGIVLWDVSLLRATHSADPQSPVWPQPAYYSLRTMATLTDGVSPRGYAAEVRELDAPYETCRLVQADGARLFGVWQTQRAEDLCTPKPARIVFPDFVAKKVVGIDTLNGVEQDLEFRVTSKGTVIKNLLVPDYPILLRVSR